MKYCIKCGNPMDDEMLFCQKCGAQCIVPGDAYESSPQQDSYAEFWELHHKDIQSGKEIELTPDGVHIFQIRGKKKHFEKMIPYSEIIEVFFEPATMKGSGYLSIITATEGIRGKAKLRELLFDQNTVFFLKNAESDADRIRQAIEHICSNPPASNEDTGYNEKYMNGQKSEDSRSLTNVDGKKKNQKVGCLTAIILVLIILVAVVAIPKSNKSENAVSENPSMQTEQEKTGKSYEGSVFRAFWEGTSDYFGVEYSDYKWTHTATSYICDYTTNGGYTAHYYLIKTAFDTKNIYGQEITHEVTARCYYVPDYSNTVYTAYLTLDGDVVSYDEATENWLMNMEDGGTAPEVTGID